MGAQSETIAAIATAPGLGGIGIVRVSGTLAESIGNKVTSNKLRPRKAALHLIRDGDNNVIDQAVVLFFKGPASFTGEDVLEIHGHGGTMVMRAVLDMTIESGARLARPGEFTERAYLNGKMDLAQAEAVADLIASGSQAAARGAMRSLRGEFSNRVRDIDSDIVDLRVFVEAAIDFSDEEIDFLGQGQVSDRIEGLVTTLADLIGRSRQGALLRDGVLVAIAGAPNVGKSSLLNAFSGEESAIVTPVPGTTRDAIQVPIILEGLPVTFVDTAGVRETEDPVEREGVKRAKAVLRRADLVLLVSDLSEEKASLDFRPEAPSLVVENKVDLTASKPGAHKGAMRISAKTGAGMQDLSSAILKAVGYSDSADGFTARKRHVQELLACESHMQIALTMIKTGGSGELIAEELKLAHEHLGEIVGITSTEDLLGEIFSSFCIGK